MIGLTCWLCAQVAFGQQVPDSSYRPTVAHPAFPPETGPVVCVDGSHLNVHTLDGQFLAFGRLLRADGYRVRSLDAPPTPAALANCGVLVIASPRNPMTLQSRRRPIRNAYTVEEAEAVHAWTIAGGALLLIGDHMPVIGSMETLLQVFSIPAIDGFATTVMDTSARQPIVYRRADGTLRSHPITDGRTADERVDSIATFTGAALSSDTGWHVLWRLPDQSVVIIPDEPWSFSESVPRIPGRHLAQGVAQSVGAGRMVFSAEAAMFTAQWEGPARAAMGMNHPAARQNAQFVLNTLHWLTAAPSR